MTFKRGAVDVADLHVTVDENVLHMKFTDNGIPIMRSGAEQDADIALATIRHGLRLLGGSVDIERRPRRWHDTDGTLTAMSLSRYPQSGPTRLNKGGVRFFERTPPILVAKRLTDCWASAAIRPPDSSSDRRACAHPDFHFRKCSHS